MELLAVGISHKTAPLDFRERLALTEGRATGVLRELVEADSVGEAAAISTCNRTELYVMVHDAVAAESLVLGVLAGVAGIVPTELVGHLYTRRGSEAARHLYRVTAGLDSMILGEAEIQGQVKRAYELAMVEGATGPVLNRLFRGALAAGKRVRSETGVSERGLSVPSVAVELARRTLGAITERQVLLVGAGETVELTARAFAARGVEPAFVANRHHDRAIGLADRFGGRAVRFEDLPTQIVSADIVVSATNSPHHVIEREGLELVMSEHKGGALLLIDLAVPRDIHPGCRDLPNVTVADMDDVQSLVERNASGREADARAAMRVLDAEVERFRRWLSVQGAVPTIAALRERAEEIVERVLAENERRWEELSDADRERLGIMARAIANRLLHEPTMRLRGAGSEDEDIARIAAARELFGLDAELDPVEGEGAEVSSLDDRRRDRRGA